MYTLFYRRFFQDVILGEIVFLGPGASPDDVITRFGLQLFIGDVMHPGTQQGDMVPTFEFPTLSVNVIYFCLCREDTLVCPSTTRLHPRGEDTIRHQSVKQCVVMMVFDM